MNIRNADACLAAVGEYTVEIHMRGEGQKLLRFDLSEQLYEDHMQYGLDDALGRLTKGVA